MSRNSLRPSSSRRFVPVVSQMEARITPSVAYTLSNNSLVAFDTTNPAAALPPLTVTGLTAGQNLVAIDFRPQNGQLYGLGYDATMSAVQLYAISYQSGVATPIGANSGFVGSDGTTPILVTGPGFGMDFNPTVDRIRVVTSTGQNFRINPNTGAFIDGNLGGAAGSVSGLNMDGAANGPATSIAGTA